MSVRDFLRRIRRFIWVHVLGEFDLSAFGGALTIVVFTVGITVTVTLFFRGDGSVPEVTEISYSEELIRATLLKGDGEEPGRFEWQWEGENWLGHVWFEDDGRGGIEARIEVNKHFKGAEANAQVLETVPGLLGTVDVVGNDVVIKDLRVVKNTFGTTEIPRTSDDDSELTTITVGSAAVTSKDNPETLEVALTPVTAFVGRVTFESDRGNVSVGDMILVPYESSIRP